MQDKIILVKNLRIFEDTSKKNSTFLLDVIGKLMFEGWFAMDREKNLSDSNININISLRQVLDLPVRTLQIRQILNSIPKA